MRRQLGHLRGLHLRGDGGGDGRDLPHLSKCLGQLTERNWVTRVVSTDTSPPSVSYCAIEGGLILHRQLRQLPALA